MCSCHSIQSVTAQTKTNVTNACPSRVRGDWCLSAADWILKILINTSLIFCLQLEIIFDNSNGSKKREGWFDLTSDSGEKFCLFIQYKQKLGFSCTFCKSIVYLASLKFSVLTNCFFVFFINSGISVFCKLEIRIRSCQNLIKTRLFFVNIFQLIRM